MKITTILCSPKVKGNTGTTLELFEDQAAAAGHETNRINLVKMKVSSCLGCGVCQGVVGKPGCVQKDDAPIFYQAMIDADLIIFATPLYCWSFTSIGQAALERCIALVSGYGTDKFESLIEGRAMALLVTCAEPEADNADLIPIGMERMKGFVKARSCDKYILAGYTTAETTKPAAEKITARMVTELLG